MEEHPLHTSDTKLQWIAIACMAIGLLTSVYYHSHILKAERLESELSSYLHLNDRYHQLLFTLIQNDHEIFSKTGDISLQKNKYIIYELFELFSTVDMLESYFSELDQDVWPIWKRRMEFLFSKPAIKYAWESHLRYADQIYKPAFMKHVETLIAERHSLN